jgi:dipeptidyl aminopeptidase/acylaminoacyl peptidase
MRIGLRLAAAAVVLGVTLALPTGALAVFPGENDSIIFVSGIGQPANDDSDADLFINELGDLTFAESEALAPNLIGQRRHPSISPDGTKIAFAVKNGANGDIYIHDRTDGSSAVMWSSPSGVDDDRPSWSPDNRHVAFESEASDGQEYEIRIFDTKQSSSADPINFTQTDDLHEGKPVWSPDGQFIYYNRGLASTNEDIVRQPADQVGVVPTNIVATGEAEYQPALSPDGTQLCYTRGPFGSSNADIYIRSSASGTSGTSGTDLSDTGNGGFNCAWSPDGTRIAWVDGIFTNGALVSEPSTDGTATPLVNNTASHFDGNPDYARLPKKCEGKPASIIGTANVDDLVGFEFRDVVQALGGNDNAVGKEGRDLMCGKGGKDNLVGGPDNDLLYGGGGSDTLKGAQGDDKCFGGPGNDTFKNCEKAVE